MSVKILDCTLRDGGYYNRWDFDEKLVEQYLAAMASAQVDFIELGFRNFPSDNYAGAHAFTSKAYLGDIELPDGPIYGAMIDARVVLSHPSSDTDCIDLLFDEQTKEKIYLVRIAAHFEEARCCKEMIQRLKSKGYMVGLNLMQSSLKSDTELAGLAKLITDWGLVDVLYFADSLGSMSGTDLERVYSAIRQHWDGEMGFHAHNNMGMALSNVLLAKRLGCTWVDSTITGMGRGAGNAETEYLLLENDDAGINSSSAEIFSLIADYFEPLKSRYKWGCSFPYYLGAQGSVHPTYVQELLADGSLTGKDLTDIISDIGRTSKPQSYSEAALRDAKSKILGSSRPVSGSLVSKFLEHKEVLLVAQTNQTKHYCNAIKRYAKATEAILISVNHPRSDIAIDFDYVAVSHNQKYREHQDLYTQSKLKYIAPAMLFDLPPENIAFDYGLLVVPGSFSSEGHYAKIPFHLTVAYATAFCVEAGARTINLAGFEGYLDGDQRQKEMQECLKLMFASGVKLTTLTPSTFIIPEGSIHAV